MADGTIPHALLLPYADEVSSTFESGILLGPTGCGKTTLAERVARRYTRAGGRAWAIDAMDAWKGTDTGVKPIWPKEGIQGIDPLLLKVQHWPLGLLIFDDADRYLRYPSQIRDDYMTCFRHYKKDLMTIARRPQGMPKDAFTNAKWVALFAGSLTEPYARKYLADIFTDDLLARVPTKPWRYLLLWRDGATWTSIRRKTMPRNVVTASDKPPR